jgi:hypothetical protein
MGSEEFIKFLALVISDIENLRNKKIQIPNPTMDLQPTIRYLLVSLVIGRKPINGRMVLCFNESL